MRRLRLTPEDVDAWRSYERAAARAADQYQALPTAAFGRHVQKCSLCRCDVPAYGLCRWCRRVA